jgi:F-type H+-transporting ATPase subunit delta
MTTPANPRIRHATVLDDETRQASRVYAEALYRAAESANDVDGVLADLDGLVQGVFKTDPGLEAYLASAQSSRKAEAVRKAFEGRSTPTFASFLGVLGSHGRLGLIRPVAEAFHALHDRKSRRVPVEVTSAVPLTDAERARIAQEVREAAHIEPILQEYVDPEILGGLIIRVLDWVYDASVKNRLEAIRSQLIERSSHGIERGRDRFGSHV